MKKKTINSTLVVVILLLTVIFLLILAINRPFLIYTDYLRIGGTYTNEFNEANPVSLQVCSTNEFMFVESAQVNISLREGQSRISKCLCGQGTAERNKYGSGNKCCAAYGYQTEVWIPDICYGCADYAFPRSVEVKYQNQILGSIVPGSILTLDLAEVLNSAFFTEISANYRAQKANGDIVPFDRCTTILLYSTDNFGGISLPEILSVNYYENNCDYSRFAQENLDICASSINVACKEGSKNTFTCWDKSFITTSNCINNQWLETSEKCREKPLYIKIIEYIKEVFGRIFK